MTIKIEKGVALIGPRRKYPFEKMEVGDSFFVPNVPSRSLRKDYARITAAVSGAHKMFRDQRFATRRVDGGVRVWRTQ